MIDECLLVGLCQYLVCELRRTPPFDCTNVTYRQVSASLGSALLDEAEAVCSLRVAALVQAQAEAQPESTTHSATVQTLDQTSEEAIEYVFGQARVDSLMMVNKIIRSMDTNYARSIEGQVELHNQVTFSMCHRMIDRISRMTLKNY